MILAEATNDELWRVEHEQDIALAMAYVMLNEIARGNGFDRDDYHRRMTSIKMAIGIGESCSN